MMADEALQQLRGSSVESQPFRDPHCHGGANLGMVTVAIRFADIVQQQGQIKNEGTLERMEERRVFALRRLLRVPDAIQLLDAHQSVLVCGVLMVKLVLNQARKFAELRNI